MNDALLPLDTSEQLYKILKKDGYCYHGGGGRWSLAHDGQPGEWMPELQGKLVPCKHGYHVLRKEHLLDWLGPAIHRVEVQGEVLWDGNKGVCRSARDLGRIEAWNDRSAREFACNCAEHVAHLWVAPPGITWQPFDTIAVARAYARGLATDAELAAARAVAWAAARAVASAVASAVARAAASAAASDAASAVASAAARAAASDAASAAARAATWAAASDAASAAARDAASAAARAATWAAARDAERGWQQTRLMEILGLAGEESEREEPV